MIRWGSKKPERIPPPHIWVELVADCFELKRGEVFRAIHEGSGVAFDTVYGRIGLGDPALYRILGKDEAAEYDRREQEETKEMPRVDARVEDECAGC